MCADGNQVGESVGGVAVGECTVVSGIDIYISRHPSSGSLVVEFRGQRLVGNARESVGRGGKVVIYGTVLGRCHADALLVAVGRLQTYGLQIAVAVGACGRFVEVDGVTFVDGQCDASACTAAIVGRCGDGDGACCHTGDKAFAVDGGYGGVAARPGDRGVGSIIGGSDGSDGQCEAAIEAVAGSRQGNLCDGRLRFHY